MAPNPRVVRAFRAMRELGIPEEKTKPVLKNLLKIYDKKWELIEEENYRALADAIFDSEEAEEAEQKKKLDAEAAEKKKKLEQAERMKAIEEETQIPEEPERPLKRLRLRHQDGQASPSCVNPSSNSSGGLLRKPKLEVNKLPESRPELQSRSKTAVTDPVSPQPQTRNKGKQPVLPNAVLQPEGPVSPLTASREKRSSGVQFKEPKVEPGLDDRPKQKSLALIKPKDEPVTDDGARFEAPLAVIRPESLNNGDFSAEKMDLSKNVLASSNETSGHELMIATDESTAKLDVGSSSCGEIKVSLTCNSALAKAKLSITNVDTVFKTIENNCRKSYKALDPNFSVKKLMNDVCECLLDLGSDSNGSLCTDDLSSPPEIPKLPPPIVEQNGFENNNLVPDDIAKGQEHVVISLINEVNTGCPPSFHYIRRNAVFQNAYVNFSLARIEEANSCSTCFGDCIKSSKPCACALQSGGEFAYTDDGLVKEELLDQCIKMNRDSQKHCLFYCKECPLERSKNEDTLQPCKGHRVRSFIKECWLKCGCNKQCGNRVVQRGIKHKLQVFMTSEGKGWGLRTLEDLPKGTFVCEYVGEVLTNAELYDRVSQRSNKDEHAYPVLLDADWYAESDLKDEEALCLDATYYGNVARFINHRCFDSNLIEIPVEIENADHHYYHLAFFTTRKVKALEELTWDYGIDFDDDGHPVKAFSCSCGSRFCRNIKPSSKPGRRRT